MISPRSPRVATTSTTRWPASAAIRMVPPVAMASSSGWAWKQTSVAIRRKVSRRVATPSRPPAVHGAATFAGAAELASRSDEPVSLLRERATSKGGTTYAALTSMEDSGVKAALVKALHAAADRGRELGEEFGKD